jgi:hypothetical protein
MSVLRRQPARNVKGSTAGGYTGAYELICGDCGDSGYLDYSEVPRRIQHPRTVHDGCGSCGL